MKRPVEIHSREYWFKVLAMLQQYWAIIDNHADSPTGQCVVFFIDDNSCVFDRLEFDGPREAEIALKRNGFL